jgi:two-component system sensor histidine kinase QseC
MSLRLRLLVSIALMTLAVWAVAAILSYRDTRQEIDRLFDAHLAESASAILVQAEHERREAEAGGRLEDDDEHEDEDDEGIDEVRKRGALLEKRLLFQIWDGHGNLLLNSRSSSPFAKTEAGYSSLTVGGHELRVYSTWNAERSLNVQVAESAASRAVIAARSVRSVLTPIFVMLIPLLALLAFVIEMAIRPIQRLSREIDQRSPDDLTPVSGGDLPREIQSPVAALNRLFARLSVTLERERHFTADAAHELRTPLAAIKIQAQVAAREADDALRQHALDGVAKGVDRVTHLVDQLLTLARLDPEDGIPFVDVPLRDVASGVLQRLAPGAHEKSIELSLEGTDAAISGSAALIEILVRNLLDNAIRYTPPGGSVECRIYRRDCVVCFTVVDSGPGLPKEQIERLGERFSRLSRPSGEGSGLGLSIVKRIVELHGAHIAFNGRSDGPGLSVHVEFPYNQRGDSP